MKKGNIYDGFERKFQNIALILFNFVFLFSLSASFVRADDAIPEKYLVTFKTNKSTCLLRVNDFPAIDSTKARLGTMSAGYNTTAFLENGKNKIELLMGPQVNDDPKTLFSDSSCQVVISKDTIETSDEVAKYILNVNGEGNITAKNSVVNNNGKLDIKVFEGYTKNKNDFGLYKLEGNVIVAGLPGWSWVDATPVTEQDLPKIKKAYEDIWMMMKNHDIEGIKAITRISNEETAYAEGASIGMMFASSNFPSHVLDKKLTPLPIDWNRYRLIPYRDGRLFRMAVGFIQNSPLKFKDAEGNVVFTYNPYFSIINGKVVLVRG